MYYVPLWMLLACLPVSALALYLGLRETELRRPVVYALSVLLSPVLLLATAFAAVVASTALSAALEEPARTTEAPAPEQEEPAPQPTEPEPPPAEPEPTTPAPADPASPGASPGASPSASPAASASASASASPAAQ